MESAAHAHAHSIHPSSPAHDVTPRSQSVDTASDTCRKHACDSRRLPSLAQQPSSKDRSLRKRPKSSSVILCPLCYQPLAPVDYQAHYIKELSTFQYTSLNSLRTSGARAGGGSYDANDDRLEMLGKGKRKRTSTIAAAMSSSNSSSSHGKGIAFDHERTGNETVLTGFQRILSKVRGNRKARSGKGKSNGESKGSHLSTASLDMYSSAVCFLCNKTIYGDSAEVNNHIDQCLIANAALEDGLDHSITTIAMSAITPSGLTTEDENSSDCDNGQAMIEQVQSIQQSSSANIVRAAPRPDLIMHDLDDDLDIAEDDSYLYGDPQYSERDVQQYGAAREITTTATINNLILSSNLIGAEINPELLESENLRDIIAQSVDEKTDVALIQRRKALNIQQEIQRTIETVHPGEHEPVKQLTNNNNLELDTLKQRIQELEIQTANMPRCLVCLEPYQRPLTSVVCWHIHCEACWLQTLSVKKLCPQCQLITVSSELRRVYL